MARQIPSGGLAAAAPGLSPVRAVLEGGAVVVAKETRKTPAVTLSLALRVGMICDPPELPGAVHLLSRVIDRGTANRTAEELAEELEGRGVSLAVAVNRHLFAVSCTCLSEDFEPVFALLADTVMAPALPAAELATRKREVVTAIRQDEDSPAIRAVEGLMRLLYGADHPYGRPPKGTLASVEGISRTALATLHRERFAPSVLSAVVVGDVAAARAVDVAGRLFGSWRLPPPPEVTASPVPGVSGRHRLVVPMMNKAQTDVAYGFTTIARSDPDYYVFSLMNNALGQYAMGGRLGDSIRERQGMAYYVSSALEASVWAGPLLIRAGVSPANVDRAVASIDEELTRLRDDGLSEMELVESRQYLIGSMPRALETNAGIAAFLQTSELFGLGLDYDVRLPELLGTVTLDDVLRVARRFLDPARATVVIAGPYQEESTP